MSNKITALLTAWRAERHIKKPLGSQHFEAAIESEVDEYTLACTNNDLHEKVDAINDILILCKNELALMGYEETLCQKQTIKEISSRRQDPAQAASDWTNEKWEKDPAQDPDSLYKADYTTCLLTK